MYAAGLRDRLLLFSTGLSIGILSSFLSNKKEFDMMKVTLKRMENLVQDLQDELEMKEGLTVKELPNETSGEHDGKVLIAIFFLKHFQVFNLFKPKTYDSYWLIIDDNSKLHIVDPEPMSKIEAELEAELARLELNITSKRLEEKTCDFNVVTIFHRIFHMSLAYSSIYLLKFCMCRLMRSSLVTLFVGT